MKLTLMIEADVSQIAMIVAALPTGATFTPVAVPMPAPVAVPMPTPVASDDDDDDAAAQVVTNAPAADTSGMPWDERIHSAKKTQTDGGLWRKRKGVDAAVIAAVEAELRARQAGFTAMPVPMMTQPAPVVMPALGQPAPLVAPTPVPVPLPVAPQPVAMPAPVAMAQPAGVVAPALDPASALAQQVTAITTPAPVAAGPLDFAQFMQHLGNKMAERDANGAPLIHAEYLAAVTAEIAAAFNVTIATIVDIGENAQMISYAQQILQRDGRW